MGESAFNEMDNVSTFRCSGIPECFIYFLVLRRANFIVQNWVSEPRDEKTCLMPYMNNKGADQPVHSCSLISVFVVHCLDSIIPLLAIAEISRLLRASVAELAGLLTWSQTPKDRFSHNVACISLKKQ